MTGWMVAALVGAWFAGVACTFGFFVVLGMRAEMAERKAAQLQRDRRHARATESDVMARIERAAKGEA